MSWIIIYSKYAQKDAKKLSQCGLKPKAEILLNILKENPFKKPPPYEKLIGDLDGLFSRRINIQHRLIYQVDKDKMLIRVLRLWSHYET